MPLSRHPSLRPISAFIGSFALAFGFTAILSPATSLSLFNFTYPDNLASKTIIDALLTAYGVRDLFMGSSVVMAAWYGHMSVLGWLLVGCGGVAGADGLVCRRAGVGGEWNHWGFAPVGVVVGMVCLGVFD